MFPSSASSVSRSPRRPARGRGRARGGPDPGGRAARAGTAERERRRGCGRARSRPRAPSGSSSSPTYRAFSSTEPSSPSIEADEADRLLDDGSFEGGIVPKLRAAVRAARLGRPRGDRRDGGAAVTPSPPIRAVLPTYARLGRHLRARATAPGSSTTTGAALPRLRRRHRRRRPRPLPPRASLAAAHAQLERLWHVSNLYWTRADVQARRPALRALRRRAGLLLQLRRRGDRGRAQVRAQGDWQARRRRARGLLPRAYARRALGVTGPARRSARRSSRCRRPVRFARPNDVESLGAACRRRHGPASSSSPMLGRGRGHPAGPGVHPGGGASSPPRHGAFLCLDEIQTGVGRTGTFFAFEQLGVRPDLVTLAKGLANGLPIGCLLVAEEAAGAFEPGDHASTFGGNPVACAAACAVVRRRRRRRCSPASATSGARAARRPRRASPRVQRRARRSGSSSAPSSIGPPPRSSPNASSTGSLVDVRRRACTSPDAAARRRPRRGRRRPSTILGEVLA